MDLATLLQNIQVEAGVGAGYGQTYAPSSYTNIDKTSSDKSGVLQAHLLARNPWLGAEIGTMKLPEYHGHAKTSDYPAYKGLPPGTYPQTAEAQQDITANGRYGRINLYGPKLWGMEPYGFYGRARVGTDNHEHAVYNDKDESDFREKLTKMAKYYGGGVNIPLSDRLKMRAEIGKIPEASDSYHTLKRDMLMGLIGLGYTF